MLGHIDLACDRRDSRHFLPGLGPSQMAGFFTSQCFHQGLSKAVIKKGDIITIKPQWQDAGNASFTWVARDDEENGRVDISAVELAYMAVWPAQTVRSEMIEATGRRLEQQGSRR